MAVEYIYSTARVGKGRIVTVTTAKQCDIALLFLRMQEFYESPFKNIRNKVFTLEEFIDTYCERFDDFDYTSTFIGFNVPGRYVRKFFKRYEGKLTDKEQKLYWELNGLLYSSDRFTLVGYPIKTPDKDTVIHELAHAFYYLVPQYRKAMQELNNKLNKRVQEYIERRLEDWMYTEKVFPDETQAYLATSSKSYFDGHFPNKRLNNEIWRKYQPAYKKLFNATLNKYPEVKRFALV